MWQLIIIVNLTDLESPWKRLQMSMRMFLQKEDTLSVCRSTTVEWDGPGLEGGRGVRVNWAPAFLFRFLTLNAVSPLPYALLPQLGPLEIMCLSLPSQWTLFPLRLGSKINMSSSCFCSGILSQLGRKVASPLSRGSKSPGGRPGCW